MDSSERSGLEDLRGDGKEAGGNLPPGSLEMPMGSSYSSSPEDQSTLPPPVPP